MPHTDRRDIEIGAARGKRKHDRRGIWVMTWPIGEEVQRRSPSPLRILNDAGCEGSISGKKQRQPVDIALLQACCQLVGQRVIVSQYSKIQHS